MNRVCALAALCFTAIIGKSQVSTCPIPSVSDTAFCPPGTYTLTATSPSGAVQWYDQPTGGNILNTGEVYSPTIYSTTTYWVESLCLDSSIVLPAHNSSFPSLSRGYWFIAPDDFIITEILVPEDGSSAPQSAELIRFNSGPPGIWPNLSNDFTSLFYAQNVPGSSSINVGVAISQGDIIGVLGTRGGVNSYTATGPVTISMAGDSVVLSRMGFQDDISNTQAYDVWSEPNLPIGRVQLFLGVAVDTSARVPLTAKIENSPDSVLTLTACYGDTINAWNQQLTTDTILFQIFTNSVGCDSIHYLVTDILEPIDTAVGILLDSSALYVLNPIGNVNYQWYDCVTNSVIPGEVSTFFYPSANGSYALMVTDNSGCSAISSCYDFTSIGISENQEKPVTIAPNPTNGRVVVQGMLGQNSTVSIFNAQGKVVDAEIIARSFGQIEMNISGPAGFYHIVIGSERSVQAYRVVKIDEP